MTALTPADLDQLGRQLREMQRSTLDELRTAGIDEDAAQAEAVHEVHTRADEAEAQRLARLHDRELQVDQARLQDIEHALQRMAEGRYGECVNCGDAIARERLLAQPTAIRCMPCQSLAERLPDA